jgi:aminoglycoside 3-N-acetyltransferase I
MPTQSPRIARLGASDRTSAKALFTMMAAVFEENRASLSDPYVDALLAREDLWVLGASVGDDIVAGLTAHTLPMTRSESREIFIYDLAVRADHQRRGIGRLLITHLRRIAAEAGIDDLFVPADDEDTHALDFYRALGGTPSPVTIFTFERDREAPERKPR